MVLLSEQEARKLAAALLNGGEIGRLLHSFSSAIPVSTVRLLTVPVQHEPDSVSTEERLERLCVEADVVEDEVGRKQRQFEALQEVWAWGFPDSNRNWPMTRDTSRALVGVGGSSAAVWEVVEGLGTRRNSIAHPKSFVQAILKRRAAEREEREGEVPDDQWFEHYAKVGASLYGTGNDIPRGE